MMTKVNVLLNQCALKSHMWNSTWKIGFFFPVDILGNQLSPSDSVRNLGVNFDSDLTISKHISDVIRSSFFHIKDLCRMRRHLPKLVATTLANALVSSRLDYCNSLFYSITDKQCRRLQAVQNTLCRIVSRINRYSSITAPMMSLHWLPIHFRVQFKVNLLTCKVWNGHNPTYLDSYIKPYKSAHNTRCRNPSTNMLSLQYYHYKTHKLFVQLSNSFSYYVPRLWKQLPEAHLPWAFSAVVWKLIFGTWHICCKPSETFWPSMTPGVRHCETYSSQVWHLAIYSSQVWHLAMANAM